MSDEDRACLNCLFMGLILGIAITVTVFIWALLGNFYADGQRDALNGVWKYQKVTTSDGVVHFIEVTTQPSK